MIDLKTRPCTLQDFGLEKGNQTFFTPVETKKEEFKNVINGNKLTCIDEDVVLYGDFNTAKARLLFLSFEKCDRTKRKTCKSDSVVQEWLKKQYLVLAYNSYNFIEDGFHERVFRKSANLDWIPIDINARKIYPYSIQINELLTDDGILISSFNNQTYPIYEPQIPFAYYFQENVLNGLMIQMSSHKSVTERHVYAFFDWLNDIGGF